MISKAIRFGIMGLALAMGVIPAKTHAALIRLGLLIGNNIGAPEDPLLQFAEQDARRMRDLLVELGGFSDERVMLLTGKKAAAVDVALDQLRGRIAEISATGNRALLLVYYSGHGSHGELHLGKDKIKLMALRERLRSLKASIVVGIFDACQSGSLGQHKGGTPDEPFDVTLYDEPSAEGSVILASSMADEAAQESTELKGSLFTHFLISALRGGADFDADGQVTVREAYLSAYHRTLARSATTSPKRQHPVAEITLSGKGDVVLSYLRKSSASIVFGARLRGRYLVVQQPSGYVAAELEKESGKEATLALPDGVYSIYKQERDEYQTTQARLAWGGKFRLDESAMTRLPYQRIAQKGFAASPNYLEALVAWNNGFLVGMRPALSAGLGYRRKLTPWWSVAAHLALARRSYDFTPESSMSMHVSQTEVECSFGADLHATGVFERWPWPWLGPSLGIFGEYRYAHQQMISEQGERQEYSGAGHLVGLGPQLSLDIRILGPVSARLYGRGLLAWTMHSYSPVKLTRYGVLITTPDHTRQNILTWSTGLGLAYEF